jgi:hypothetical protein
MVPTDVGDDRRAPTQHRLEQGQRHALCSGWQHERVVLAPHVVHSLDMPSEGDLLAAEPPSQLLKANALLPLSAERDLNVTDAPLRLSQHAQQDVLTLVMQI